MKRTFAILVLVSLFPLGGPAQAQDALTQRLEEIIFLYYDSYGREATDELLKAGVSSVSELLLSGWTIDDIEQTVWRVLNEVPEAATKGFDELVVAKAQEWGKPGAAAAEEPAVEEPVVEEPTAEEPVAAEEPSKDDAATADAGNGKGKGKGKGAGKEPEPAAEEPAVEEPVAEEPVAEETALTKEDPREVIVKTDSVIVQVDPEAVEAAANAAAEAAVEKANQGKYPVVSGQTGPDEALVMRYEARKREFAGKRAAKLVGGLLAGAGLAYGWAEQGLVWRKLGDFTLTLWSAFPLFGPVLLVAVLDANNHGVVFDASGNGSEQSWKNFAIRGAIVEITTFTTMMIFVAAPNDRPVPPKGYVVSRRPPPRLVGFSASPTLGGAAGSLSFRF